MKFEKWQILSFESPLKNQMVAPLSADRDQQEVDNLDL